MCDEGLNGKLNWAKHTHEVLIQGLRNYVFGNRIGKKSSLLQIRFYNYLAGLESKKFGNSELPTRISAWGNEKIKMLFSKNRGFQATPKSKGR